MPEYINPNGHSVHLTGPNGKTIKIKSRQRIVLPDYFDRYMARDFIKLATDSPLKKAKQSVPRVQKVQSKRPTQISVNKKADRQKKADKHRHQIVNKARKIIRKRHPNKTTESTRTGRKLIVGRQIAADAAKLLQKNLASDCFPISNNIGIGILSFNRKESLKRLLDSISVNTDLRRTTVFISDDCSTDPATIQYLDSLSTHSNFIVLRNTDNLGVAGNSNRLIRCLTRFNYGLLLNDDVEVLKPGWDEFYVEAIRRTSIHHFSFLQPGVYGAKDGELITRRQTDLRVVHDKPHGAILAFTREMLASCGYFNEDYGQYGMEHIDWSLKPHEFGLQERGFFDVEGSRDYFKVYRDPSAVENRPKLLNQARKIHAKRQPKKRVGPSPESVVPSISYVIPCRNTDRQNAIETVVNNVRAQRFPVVHIVLVEQDVNTKLVLEPFKPIQYYLAQEKDNRLFNKSKAFNLGVNNVVTESVVLHDADMLIPGSYTTKINNVLKSYDACHLGETVIYTSPDAAKVINNTGVVTETANFERVVGYFEGGSLASRVNTFWKIGAFNEDFWGYGCEDCEFYSRLSQNCNWYEDRKIDFIHLWHGRVENWNKHHKENKALNRQLESQPMPERIKKQHAQLHRLGYSDKI